MALDIAAIPGEAPRDAIMSAPDEVEALADWALSAFAGRLAARQPGRVKLDVRRQDHNVLRFGQSVLQSPLRLGGQRYKRGLGTHANSEIVVTVPPGARTFKAFVGLDNNADTRKGRGSIAFVVEVGGQAVFRSRVLRCGDEPVPVGVDLPDGTRQLVLKVDATPDGTGWDHADWAEARLAMADGSVSYLQTRR